MVTGRERAVAAVAVAVILAAMAVFLMAVPAAVTRPGPAATVPASP